MRTCLQYIGIHCSQSRFLHLSWSRFLAVWIRYILHNNFTKFISTLNHEIPIMCFTNPKMCCFPPWKIVWSLNAVTFESRFYLLTQRTERPGWVWICWFLPRTEDGADTGSLLLVVCTPASSSSSPQQTGHPKNNIPSEWKINFTVFHRVLQQSLVINTKSLYRSKTGCNFESKF